MSTYDWRNDPNLTQDQKDAFARAERLYGSSTDADAPEGFLSSGYNAVVRGLSNLRNIPTVSMAEDFSALAEQNQDLTERAASGELSFLERLYYGKNYGRSGEQIDQTKGLAAEYAGAAAQRQADAYANYPMSERGREGLQALQQSETFKDVGSAILDDPLGVASGVAQVAVEQAPTIAAATVASRLGSPGAGISLFGASGFTQERYGQLINEAAEAGYDLNNPDQARAAVEDREFMQRQAKRGFTRGMIIGAVDLATMGLASKTPFTLKGVGTNTGIQIVGGGTGEAVAELADTGEINPGEIAIEALAEGVTAPVDVAALGLGRNSETKLDSDAASAQTADELALLAQQQAEQQEANDLAVAQEQSRKEMLQRNVDLFPAREDYVAERKKARVADLDDTTSELHATYRQWKMENNLLLRTGSKEDNAAKKRFLKETTPENETEQLHAEHEQALEAFAIEREAASAPQVNPAQDKELPSPIEISKADGRRKAPTGSEKLDLAASASSPIIPPSASTSAMEAQVQGELPSPLVVGEDGLMQAGPLVPQLSPEITRAVEAARLKDAGKAPKVKAAASESSKPVPLTVPEADPAAMKVYSQKTATAKVEALAAAKALPDDWSSAFPELDSALNAAKFKIKPFNAALNVALTVSAVSADPTTDTAVNPQAAPEVTDTPVNTLAEEGTTEEAAQSLKDPKALKLSVAQDKIFKVLDDHLTGDKKYAMDEVFAGGQFLDTNIAKLAGVKNKQHVATSIDRFKTKFLEAQGLLKPRASKAEKDAAVAAYKERLRQEADEAKQAKIMASREAATAEDAVDADISQTADTAEQNVDGSTTETVDRDPNSYLDEVSDDGEGSSSIFAEMGIDSTVASVGQGNYSETSATNAGIAESNAKSKQAYKAANEQERKAVAERNELGRQQAEEAGTKFTPEKFKPIKDLTAKQIEEFAQKQTTSAEEVAAQAAEQNAKNLQRNIDFAMQEVDARMVFSEWDALKSDSTPAFAKVSKQDRYDWMMSVLEYQESNQSPEDLQLLTADLREIEQRLEETANDVQPTESNQGSAAQSAERTDEARAPPTGSQGQGSTVDSEAGADTSQDGETTGVQGAAQNAPVVERKPKKRVVKKPKPTFSLAESEAQATSTTANSVKDAVKWFIGKDANWRTSVVNNPDDLIGMVLSKQLDIDGLTLGSILDKSTAQGVVVTDNDGVTRAFMFADNIAPGNERAAIAHELGGHIGMDNVLTGKQKSTAAVKIRDWAGSEATSLEKTISERALARVDSAQKQDAAADLDSETIAYFLEEAVKAGVNPNSDAKTDLVSFVRQLWADFKRALRKLRPENEAALSAQDLVQMARGAARLELATDFHGATSPFRKANPDYFGLGNNAIGVGFYISEDQTEGTKYMMRRMNERRATEGVLERIDTTVAEDEYINWQTPLRKQPNILTALQQMPEDIQAELMEEVNNTPKYQVGLENLNGRQLYLGLASLQLKNYVLENSISDAAYDRANRHSRETTTAMEITSAFLNGLGVKGIKTEIKAGDGNPDAVFNKIIFDDKNIVVVGRNEAADVDMTSTTPGSVRFSVPESETQSQTSWVRKNLGNGAAEALTNLRVLGQKPLDATKNLDRLVRENEQKMPSARKWFDFMLDAEATRNEVLSMVEGVVNQSRPIKMERKELVNDFVGMSTFYQKWGYDPEWTDRKTGQPVKVTIDPILKRRYDALSAEEQQLARDIFSHGRTIQEMMQEVAEKLGVSKFFKFDSKLQGPYAPLKRFGDYVGELKSQKLLDAEAAQKNKPSTQNRKAVEELKTSADHYVISFFESQGAADTFVEANRSKYAYAEAAEKSVTYEESRPGGAQAYEKILGAVNANLAGLDQSSKDAMAKMVRDMYFQTLDDSNARLSGIKRLNRAGYDKDMLRAFAEHGMAQSNLIAQIKHGADISSALVAAREEAGKNPKALLPVYNKIALKFQRMMTPRTGMLASLETNVMKFNSFYMLTSSLGYFFQNMTQPYFAVANVSGEFGWNQAQTWGKLLSGYGVAKKVINTGFLNQVKNVASMGLLGGNSTVELNIDKAPPELRPVLKELQARGLLDVGITEDLRHVNMTPNTIVRAYDEMTHRLYQSARYVEANNRIASAVAAFKMAQQNPQKMKKLKMTPAEFAIRIVQDTQGNFSQLDAPAAFDVLPKAPLQFRKYQFQMGWLHLDAVKQAFYGADPATKMAGFRKFSLMMGYTGVLGGLASVPMANVATSLVQAAIAGLSGDDEENPPKDLERWIGEYVEDERTATLLSRGVPAALGWDFSQKLDQSDLFMPYNSKYVDLDPSRDGALLFAAQMALGPTGTVVGNMGNIADFINRGNYYRATEYAMPKGLRAYFETMRFADKGYETRAGLKITDPTTFDAVDYLTNAIGLPSTDINRIKWTRGQQIEIEQWFSSESTRIKRGYLSANESRDRKAMSEYRDEFRELQKAKDRVRPFFNNSRNVLKRAPVTELLKAPRARVREQRRLDSVTGN